MNKLKIHILIYLLVAFSPFIASAQYGQNLFGVIDTIFFLLSRIIPLIFALALVYFLWGVAQYILKSDDETARKEGNKKMLYGIIALFVMVSVWGLVALLGNTLGVGGGGFIPLPFI